MGAALNDLAYAVNDTIKDPANFKALNVLIQEMINNAVMQALNNTFGTEGASPLNVLIGNGNADVKNAITSLATTLANGGGVPVVRKIQIGTLTTSLNSDVNVTLSGFKDVNKMIVLLDGHGGKYMNDNSSNYRYAHVYMPYISALTATKLSVKVDGSSSYGSASTTISYQVIEFW